MKNKYERLKWVLLIILGGILFLLAKSASAAPTTRFHDKVLQQQITGIVTGEKNLPLEGVTVFIKGKNKGTITNEAGKFSLTAATGDILVFSFIGYKPREVKVSGTDEINITLMQDVASLGSLVINAGYYKTNRRESTGSIARVTAKEIESQPVVSPLLALQGRMAGVEVLPGGDQPGMAPVIRIRGTNSLREDGNYPLYIIDGVPVNSTPLESNSLLAYTGIDPLNTLDLANIESIEVLKDADATSIYGSRGANGVVLITTKQGIAGKTRLNAEVFTGAARVPNRLDLLNTRQYIQIRKKAFENDGVEPTDANAYDLTVWEQNRYTDWQDFFFGGTSQINRVNINATGGNENTTYRLSGSYFNQGTVYPGDYSYNKVTAGINLNHTSDNKKLKFNLSVNYGLDVNNLTGNVDLSYYAFNLSPNAPAIFNEDGSLAWEEWNQVGLDNPLAGFFNTSKTSVNNLVSNFGFSYAILKGLDFKTTAGYTRLQSSELEKLPLRSYSPASRDFLQNQSFQLNTERTSWIVEPQLSYSLYSGNAKINALVGATFQQAEAGSQNLLGQGYVAEALIGNLSAAQSIINSGYSSSLYRYNALFGRLGFTWEGKYILNLTGRRDGSSRFGPGKRLATFGALGAAWIFSEEPFIHKIFPFLSFGKLRASYGTTGNDQIGDYGYLDAYEATRGPGGLYPVQLANPDYSWEVNKKLEAAINLGLFKDRLNIGVNWYRNRSSSQLVGYPLPSITGFTTIQSNLPATVENRGWETEISSLNLQSEKFSWRSSFNISFPRNKLISYPNLEQSSYAHTYRVDQPLNIDLLYSYQGIDPETGYYKVTDVNNDGRLDYQDENQVWDRGRKLFGGLGNTFTYKNFTLQFVWEFVKQKGTLGLFNAGTLNNNLAEVTDALNGTGSFQRISQSIDAAHAYSYVLHSTFPIVDASYWRLKTLSLGYSLPKNFLGILGMDKGSLSLNGQNLLTLTPYNGMEPEMPVGGTSYAALRTITAGIQLQF